MVFENICVTEISTKVFLALESLPRVSYLPRLCPSLDKPNHRKLHYEIQLFCLGIIYQ